MNAPIMLTINKAAEQAGVPVHALRQWMASGMIHSVRSGKKHFVSWASLARFLEGDNSETTQEREVKP